MNPSFAHRPPAPSGPSSFRDDVAEGLKRGVLLAAALCTLALPPGLASRHAKSLAAGPSADAAPAAAVPAAAAPAAPRFADFGPEKPSDDARLLADWIVDADDHGGLPFVILDKRHARVYVFHPDGHLDAATPVLLGHAVGDDSVPGIGSRPIAEVRPEERTTPAGRFVGERGRNAIGEDVVWVDYEAAVSMHRVRATNPAERRLERLASPTTDDNRISYGCINMPVAFFETKIAPLFMHQRAMVYVMPEVHPLLAVFPAAYDVAARHGVQRPSAAEQIAATTPG